MYGEVFQTITALGTWPMLIYMYISVRTVVMLNMYLCVFNCESMFYKQGTDDYLCRHCAAYNRRYMFPVHIGHKAHKVTEKYN